MKIEVMELRAPVRIYDTIESVDLLEVLRKVWDNYIRGRKVLTYGAQALHGTLLAALQAELDKAQCIDYWFFIQPPIEDEHAFSVEVHLYHRTISIATTHIVVRLVLDKELPNVE